MIANTAVKHKHKAPTAPQYKALQQRTPDSVTPLGTDGINDRSVSGRRPASFCYDPARNRTGEPDISATRTLESDLS